MIPVHLWGWTNNAHTSTIRKQFEVLQHERRYKMPQICELPEQTLPLIVINVTAQIMASRGKPNVQIIFLHPEFRMLALKTITDGFQTIIRAATFHTKTFIIFCDATGSFPNNGHTPLTAAQINAALRRLATQYPLNTLYLDLHQVVLTRDWTNSFNLRLPGQVKLGQAIVRALDGTPKEVFEYG